MEDVIVVGSGFGGAFAAWPLVRSGRRVLMLERGDWVRRGPANWAPEGLGSLTPHYRADAALRARGRGLAPAGAYSCVGGPSVFYGGVSLRFRREDFAPDPLAPGGGRPAWPIGYEELRPSYAEAEAMLGVAGASGLDPTAPPRLGQLPNPPLASARVSARMVEAATRLGLAPFPLPLAIQSRANGRPACVRCPTCDGFACAIGAKNDVATAVLPGLLEAGLTLRTRVAATRIVVERGRVAGVEAVDLRTGERCTFPTAQVVLAAGALFSPLLLLASGLAERSSAPHLVGANLMRHVNGIVYGFFPFGLDGAGEHHKQVGINDFYFGDPHPAAPPGRLGNLQQVPTPVPAYAVAHLPLPRAVALRMGGLLRRLTGFLAVAEDQPRLENRVTLDGERDGAGLPRPRIQHGYTRRDLAARDALLRRAREILREAGAVLTYTHFIDTFSHAVGTLRMGVDPARSVLDPRGCFRGVEGLRVTDGSFMPTSTGTNPSLTIAANALRVGEAMVREDP